ncbi:hypothetical protein Enr13x_66460 [Stieleria neptunia]|uniref:Uncharacterized protein n=1 Tax=Stieleria neptunia TaxID=2527979 RepID=A0A518I145_9BACT|nr:hypothetical protein Enr13x_66460 [Stieleria neptunia]
MGIPGNGGSMTSGGRSWGHDQTTANQLPQKNARRRKRRRVRCRQASVSSVNVYVHRVSGGKRWRVSGLIGTSLPLMLSSVQRLVERGLRSAPMSWDRLDRCLGVYPIERPVVRDSSSCPQRMDLIGRAPSVPSVAMAVPCEILQRHHAACPCFSRQEYASEGGSRPAENS